MEFTVEDRVYDDDIKYLVGHQYNRANSLLAKVDVMKILTVTEGENLGEGINEFITAQGDPDFLIGIAACVFKPKGKAWKHDDYETYKEDLGYADVKYLLHGLGFFLTLSPIMPKNFHPFLREHLMLSFAKNGKKKIG